MKKRHLQIASLRPLNCFIEVNSSYELHESDLWGALHE
jgi:hypothetical protein